MPTTDQLQTQINQVNSRVDSLESRITSLETRMHNSEIEITSLRLRVTENENTLKTHNETINRHESKILLDSRRLFNIENAQVFYKISKGEYSSDGLLLDGSLPLKRPSVTDTGSIKIYLPGYSRDMLIAINKDMPGFIDYKWYQKIFNPSYEKCSVCLDFDDSNRWIKSISLGPNAGIKIVLPLEFHKEFPYTESLIGGYAAPNYKLLINSCYTGILCDKPFIKYDELNEIILYNYTSGTINLKVHEPIVELVPLYGYNLKNIQNK